MTNGITPYLCGGTFLSQVLRARKDLTTADDHTKSQKESLSEPETFRRLISIYQLKDFTGGTSLKPYTTRFKSCTDSLVSYTQFGNSDLRLAFDSAVKTGSSAVTQMMSDFVGEFIDVKSKGGQLIRCLLGLLMDDTSILPEEVFFMENGEAVTKAALVNMNRYMVEPFLLAIWHYIIMNRARKNELGAATYKSWFAGRGNYIGTIGNDINRNITVKSVPVVPFITGAGTKGIIQRSNTSGSAGKQYSESDRQLLQEFTSDYDELVMKCIGSNFAELVMDKPLYREISSLYTDKWCAEADKFESLSLKPAIWSLLNCLNEFCEVLNPVSPDTISPSLRQIQVKLRNLYVKLHPCDYANVFLYDAIYDDWSLGEDY